MTVEMSKLLSILISHFGSEGQTQVAETLRKLRDEPLGTVVTPLDVSNFGKLRKPEKDVIDWQAGDTVRIRQQHWTRSRGIRGTAGRIVKVNRKRLKIVFEGQVEVINVPKHMLDKI